MQRKLDICFDRLSLKLYNISNSLCDKSQQKKPFFSVIAQWHGVCSVIKGRMNEPRILSPLSQPPVERANIIFNRLARRTAQIKSNFSSLNNQKQNYYLNDRVSQLLLLLLPKKFPSDLGPLEFFNPLQKKTHKPHECNKQINFLSLRRTLLAPPGTWVLKLGGVKIRK